jgi:hypothetical protein
MNRRTFLSMLGLAPLLPLAARLSQPKPSPLAWDSFVGYTFIPTQLLIRTQLGPTPKEEFDKSLEENGLLSFSERIDVLPMRCNAVQIMHTADAAPFRRMTWVDGDDDLEKAKVICRANTRVSLRRYWAQQVRWNRKAQRARARK